MTVRKTVIVVGLLMAMTGAAYAQDRSGADPEDVAKKRDAAVLDTQYKRILELTRKREQKVEYDPWAELRAPSDSKAKH